MYHIIMYHAGDTVLLGLEFGVRTPYHTTGNSSAATCYLGNLKYYLLESYHPSGQCCGTIAERNTVHRAIKALH